MKQTAARTSIRPAPGELTPPLPDTLPLARLGLHVRRSGTEITGALG